MCLRCGTKTFQTTAKFCFKCGNNLARTAVHESNQQLSKCVRCQKELQMSGQPFCDECGAHQEVREALTGIKQDDIEQK